MYHPDVVFLHQSHGTCNIRRRTPIGGFYGSGSVLGGHQQLTPEFCPTAELLRRVPDVDEQIRVTGVLS